MPLFARPNLNLPPSAAIVCRFMSPLFYARGIFATSLLLAVAASPAIAQGNYTASAGEYSAVGSLVGDQVFAQVAIRPSGVVDTASPPFAVSPISRNPVFHAVWVPDCAKNSTSSPP